MKKSILHSQNIFAPPPLSPLSLHNKQGRRQAELAVHHLLAACKFFSFLLIVSHWTTTGRHAGLALLAPELIG
jgi:hypothetical protein